jgi:hypothetical protein
MCSINCTWTMTRKLVEYKIEDGGSLWIEVDEIDPSGIKNFGAELGEKQHLEEVLSTIKPFATSIFSNLCNLTPSPDEIEVGFGVKLNTKVGAILASASAEANYDIKLKWVNRNARK